MAEEMIFDYGVGANGALVPKPKVLTCECGSTYFTEYFSYQVPLKQNAPALVDLATEGTTAFAILKMAPKLVLNCDNCGETVKLTRKEAE